MHTTIKPVCHRQLFIFLTLLVLLVPALVQGNDRLGDFVRANKTAPPHNARLQSLLDAAVRDGLPAVSLRVKGAGIDFQGAAGVADVITGEPLTTNHVMYTASLGKTFTASVALQLVDEGRLVLEVPITTWLPGEVAKRIPSSGKITLRHLLSHTSGLIDYMNDQKAWRSEFVRDPYRHWAHSDIVPYIYDKPLLFEPGTSFDYSNSNYILVGMIIEQVTGQPLHKLIRKRILVPLGLEHTFNGNEKAKTENRAHGYIKRRGRIIDTFPWYSHYGLADSGMNSTPGDLALFIRSLFNTEKILSETMRSKMTNVSGLGHPPSQYGMGIFAHRDPQGVGRWYEHDGIDPGYQADMMYLSDLDLAIVLAANASMGKVDNIYEKLIVAVVQVALGAVRN